MIITIALSIFSLVGIKAQCGFTISQNGCQVTCNNLSMPTGSFGSLLLESLGNCDNSPANPVSSPPGAVGGGITQSVSFNINPQQFPCSYEVKFTVEQPFLTCSQNITVSATSSVNITPTVIKNTVNNTITINYDVCLTGGTTNAGDILLNLLPQAGLVYQNGNFVNGQATIKANTLTPGVCQKLQAIYSFLPTIDPCSTLNVEMKVAAFCTQVLGTYQNVVLSNPNTIGTSGGQTLVSSLPPTAFNNNPVIEGELIFNTPNNSSIPNSFLLFGKNLWMKANSSITVNAPIALAVVLGSNIRGCEMWKGITLKDGSSMQVGDGLTNSKVEDAYRAIDLDNAMLTTQAGAEFNHNQWAIRAGKNASLNILNTVFDGGALKDGTNALRGMVLNQTNYGGQIIQNKFRNYQDGQGIYAYNFGQLTLGSNRFSDCFTGVKAYVSPQKGVSQLGALLVYGLGNNDQDPKSFENCEYRRRCLS
jgi:hypothetical protein